MLKEFVKKNYRRFHFSLSVNLLFLLFFATVFYCQFETNDDYAMKMIASGAFGSPDSHLIYINSFIGYILKTFYTLTPHIPWYEVFQFLLILISLSAVMYVLINRESNNLYLILLLMTVFLSAHSLYTTLQFTRTASILAIAGYLLLDDSIRKRRKIGIASSIVLIIFSSMIRQNQFLVMSLLCTKVFLPMLYDFVKDWKNETKKGDVLRLILSGAICLLLFVCANLFHKADYQGEEWDYFNEFNGLRAAVLDRQEMVYEENPEFYQKLGLSKTDFDMLAAWNNDDPDVFNVELFRAMYDSREELAKQDSLIVVIKALIFDSIDFFFGHTSEYFFTFLFFFVFSFFIFSKQDKKNILFVWISILVMAFCILYCYFYRNRFYMSRTHISILLCGIFIILYRTKIEKQKLKFLPVFVTVLLLCLSLSGTWFGEFRVNSSMKDKDLKKISALKEIRADGDHMYFKSTDENLDFVHGLFLDSNSYACVNMEGLGGWTTNIPMKLDHLAAYGFRNIFKELVDNEKAYLIINDEERLQTILDYVIIHYNKDAKIKLVKTIEANKPYGVYQIVSR